MYDINYVWRRLLNELMDRNMSFDIVNNVLSFKGLPEGCRGLWLHFNEIRIAEEGDKIAGDMLILENYNFNDYNEITFYTRGC